MQRDRLKKAVKDAYGQAPDGKYPTIYDVHNNYVDALNGGADSLSGILGDLVDMELFTPDAGAVVTSAEFCVAWWSYRSTSLVLTTGPRTCWSP